ncbi:MAG: aspartate aminotransferase family protein [Candidatus Methanomethylophilaceae archaeon]|nr:aspartate aminotransferase family protein [Candidatus Methanomethylophilaceae archaeon]
MEFNEIKEKSSKYLFQNYGRADLSFTHGEGCYLYDTEGKEYLDLIAGIAVNAVGYAHPKWVEAMQAQVSRMAHVSNLFHIEEQAVLAENIAGVTPGNLDRTLFVNSGAEANEGALKVAVRYTGRDKVLSALNSFHGRTAAALGATGQPKYQDTFQALISGAFDYFDFGDLESVKAKMSKDVAAVMVEPIQGEGGVRTASKEFFKGVRDLCDDYGALMVVDEVQTGIGRTGQWYGIQNFDVVPDIITMAKGLGRGAPIGAVTTTDEISAVMVPGTHGTTFGGNPLVCASGNAVFDIMKSENLVENSREVGARWMADIRSLESDKIKEVRGYGLIIGIEMESNEAAAGIQKACREDGILVNVCHGNVVRLIPPLIINDEQKDRFTSVLEKNL